jgi:hypothetical protein
MSFQLNQVVMGKVAGIFIILDFREVNNEPYVQVKEFNPATQKTGVGGFCLPITAIKPVGYGTT